jgi:hypothetical protein
MKRLHNAVLFTLSCLPAAPLVAQPAIGGNACSSATLNGIYAFALTGRQVTASGTFSNVFQGNGSATFDGLSKVTVTMTTDTIQAVGTPLTWTGTYTMQANCFGAITITSGGSAVLNLLPYDGGTNFLVTGNDSTYSYSGGTGNNQPTGCSAATFSGVYMFTGTGFNLSSGAVNGVDNGSGLLQFDGVSSVTANFTLSASGNITAAGTLTGSYSVSSTCVGSATLSSSAGITYVMALSVSNANTVSASGFYVTLAANGKVLVSGTGHPIYGQPTTTAANQGVGGKPAAELLAELSPETVTRRKI